MTTNDSASNEIDAALAARLERLSARRAAPESPPTGPALPSSSAGPKGPKRRRHPARKSRVAALALSLATTGTLTTAFAAMDGPSSSTVTAAGSIVTNTSNTTAVPTATTAPAATAPSATTGSAATTASAATTVPATTTAPAASATTTVNGDVYTNKWGPVQVQAIFGADGKLVSVDAIQSPYVDGKSVRINDRAVPVLNSEVLSSQTAKVDTVSGATYTSVDYERSLQSAIDAARAAGVTQLV